MRQINKIIIHCSATPPAMDIGAATIDRWHKERGFSKIGYHEVIKRSGEVQDGRNLEEVGAHVKGHNSDSIGVCMVGGVDKYNDPENNFTDEQLVALRSVIKALLKIFPKASIHGHNEFAQKACPSFNVQEWLACTYLGDDKLD